jgi:hypothetical protein
MEASQAQIQLHRDAEAEARILGQLILLLPEDADWGRALVAGLGPLMNKALAAGWHVGRIRDIDGEERRRGLKAFKRPDAPLKECQALACELEALVFQLREALRLLGPALLPCLGQPLDFGRPGPELASAFAALLKASGLSSAACQAAEALVQHHGQGGLAQLDGLQRQLAERSGAGRLVYRPQRHVETGQLVGIASPKLLGREAADTAASLRSQALSLLQDMISLSVLAKLGPGHGLAPVLEAQVPSAWQEAVRQGWIKHCLVRLS